MKTVITHNGSFHADEVFACAVLAIFHGEVDIVRTRDMSIEADYCVDVGLNYDGIKHFDHHQRDPRLIHDNEVPMAAFGLVWRHFGYAIAPDDYAFNLVDNTLVSTVDAADNGMFLTNEYYSPYSLSHMISDMNSDNIMSKEQDEAFLEAVKVAKRIILNAVSKAMKDAKDYNEVKEIFSKVEGNLATFNKYLNFRNNTKEFPNIRYIVFPTAGEWRVQVTDSQWNLEPFTSDNPDFVFCHKAGFIFGTKTKEVALELLKQHGNV